MLLVPRTQQVPTNKHTSRRGLQPCGLLIHFTAGADGTANGGTRTLHQRIRNWAADDEWKSSTDLIVARNPQVEPTLQMTTGAPGFENYTWHCGGSLWYGQGRATSAMLENAGFWDSLIEEPARATNLNLIGLDADNYGPLELYKGKHCYRRSRKAKQQGRAARPFNGPIWIDPATGDGWEAYTDEQIAEMCRITYLLYAGVRSLRDHLHELPDNNDVSNATCITGHEDIRSTKQDPGPAFEQYWPEIYNSAHGRYYKGVCEV